MTTSTKMKMMWGSTKNYFENLFDIPQEGFVGSENQPARNGQRLPNAPTMRVARQASVANMGSKRKSVAAPSYPTGQVESAPEGYGAQPEFYPQQQGYDQQMGSGYSQPQPGYDPQMQMQMGGGYMQQQQGYDPQMQMQMGGGYMQPQQGYDPQMQMGNGYVQPNMEGYPQQGGQGYDPNAQMYPPQY